MKLLALAIDQIQKPLVEHVPDPKKKVEPKKQMTLEERRARQRAYSRRNYDKNLRKRPIKTEEIV